MALKENVKELNQMILGGQILEAFEKFYHEDVVMQENETEPRKGKDANREYEKQFVNSVEAWHDAKVKDVAVNEDDNVAMTVFYMDLTFKGGQRAKREQVSVQHWEDGKIKKEKFYYNE